MKPSKSLGMIYRLLLIVLLLSAHALNARAGNGASVDPKLKAAYVLLSKTESGKVLLKQAFEMDVPVVAGAVSKTDVTATRVFSSKSEEFKFKAHVTIAEDKEPVFQALDLAHELVHATHSNSNPFDPGLDAATYVKHGIEGEGGEAKAIAEECSVGKELTEAQATASTMKADTVNLVKARCQFVWETSQDESRWKQSFYYLGHYYREFMKNIVSLNIDEKTKNDWAEKVEPKSPMFASAVAHKPYPLALLEEYVEVTRKVCNRAKTNGLGRTISSIAVLEERCQTIGVSLSL